MSRAETSTSSPVDTGISRPSYRGDRTAVEIISHGRTHRGFILEASGYDVRCSISTAIRPGDSIEMVFPSRVPTVDVSIPGIVHWVHRSGDFWKVGVALCYPVPRDFLMANPGCRRQSIRFDCCVQGTVIWNGGGEHPAIAVNYCRDGICLMMLPVPVVGTVFQFIRQRTAQETDTSRPVVQIEGYVRWTGLGSDGFLAGCEVTSGFGYPLSGIPVGDLLSKLEE